MSNLLDKASIILTPTAYNNGEALCVKPSDGSGDFDFSRNSAATRVNAQGLVENVQILSSNLVQNGDFSEEGAEEVSNGSFSQEGAELITNGDFTNNIDGWLNYISVSTWDNGTIKTTCTLNAAWIRQNNVVTANKYYKVTFKAKASNISQNIKIYNGTFTDTGLSFDEVDVYQEFTYYLYTTVTDIIIGQQTVSVGDTINFDNVSVREVGQDWTFTNWSLTTGNVLLADTGGYVYQSNVFEVGKSYKVSVNVKDYTSGNLRIDSNGANNWTPSGSNSVATIYISNLDKTYLLLEGTFIGSITNISVKEVGQNWEIQTGWSIANNKLNCLGASSQIEASTLLNFDITKKYKLVFTISGVDSGTRSFRVYTQGSNGGVIFSYTAHTNGTYEYYYDPSINGTKLAFQTAFNQSTFSIDDVSVIEITDDTNLPRINYEGFSYQDALGSELVLNGDFSNGTNDWGITSASYEVSNGELKIYNQTSNPCLASQSVIGLIVGKQYKVSVTSRLGGSGGNVARASFFGNIFASSNGQSVTETIIMTATSTSGTIGLYVYGTSSTEGYFDNVSVKEYLGQEVVPDSGCGSWLFEPQSTNLVTDSQNYNSTYWGGQRGTLSDGGVGLFYLSPTSNVIKYEVTTTGFNQLYYRLPSAVTIGNTYTQQGYVKCDDAPYIIFQIQPLTGNPSIVWDNINNVVISSDPSIDSFNITSLNGWVKAEITYTATVASIYASLKTYFSTTTSNTQGVPIGTIAYQTFVQVEQNSFSTSYIPTEGSTVTRNQDLCNNGGSLASINSTEGVLYAEIASLSNEVPSNHISLSDGTYNNRISLMYSVGTNVIRAFLRVGGASQADLSFTGVNIKEFHKVAFKYKENDFALWIDGVEVRTDTSGSTIPSGTLTKLAFSEISTTGGAFNGKTKAVAVWKEALSDAELIALTS